MNNLCYKTSNNKHFGCPPRMDDGRHFTDYRANCHVNNIVRSNNTIMNSFQYRMFLTHNADKFINLNRKYSCQKNCCGPCQKNSNGILRQNGKENSNNVKINSLLDELPVNQESSCCSQTKDLFNYYGDIDSKIQGDGFTRATVQGGGKAMSGGDPKPFNM
jgi:hypothetical protein